MYEHSKRFEFSEFSDSILIQNIERYLMEGEKCWEHFARGSRYFEE